MNEWTNVWMTKQILLKSNRDTNFYLNFQPKSFFLRITISFKMFNYRIQIKYYFLESKRIFDLGCGLKERFRLIYIWFSLDFGGDSIIQLI